MKAKFLLWMALCAFATSTTHSFDKKEAQEQIRLQKKRYKEMKELMADINECWHAAQAKFVVLLEKTNYVPRSELVQVHAEEMEAIRDRCLALEKFYDTHYSNLNSSENQG